MPLPASLASLLPHGLHRCPSAAARLFGSRCRPPARLEGCASRSCHCTTWLVLPWWHRHAQGLLHRSHKLREALLLQYNHGRMLARQRKQHALPPCPPRAAPNHRRVVPTLHAVLWQTLLHVVRAAFCQAPNAGSQKHCGRASHPDDTWPPPLLAVAQARPAPALVVQNRPSRQGSHGRMLSLGFSPGTPHHQPASESARARDVTASR
mmetsp:Transcript_79320/g.157108  ORF Transcript_79320/g.157108 Transcript_79320/m.157108 type:complete len:208 (-) Transcript_79320:2297-2920(-)